MATTKRLKTGGNLTRRIDNAERRHNELASRIVQKYVKHDTIHRLGEPPLPSLTAVLEILADLFEIMAPGYGNRHHLKPDNVRSFVRAQLASLEDRLTDQIVLARRAVVARGEASTRNLRPAARRTVRSFMEKIPDLMDDLADDVICARWRDPAAQCVEEILLSYPGPAKAIWMHRVAHELHLLNVPLIPRMVSEYAHEKTGIDIHPGATIGRRFFTDHGTGIVIGETAEIGDDVTVYQGVTFGALSLPRDANGYVRRDGKKRHPTVKDGAVIYANATILGHDTVVGEGAVIGASAWVTQSVAPGQKVGRNAPSGDQRQQPALHAELPAPREMTEEEEFQFYLHKIGRCDDN